MTLLTVTASATVAEHTASHKTRAVKARESTPSQSLLFSEWAMPCHAIIGSMIVTERMVFIAFYSSGSARVIGFVISCHAFQTIASQLYVGQRHMHVSCNLNELNLLGE